MRIMAFSDLHHSRGKAALVVAASAEADLVIGAGDFCNRRAELPGVMSLLRDLKTPAIFVPGNHESAEELSEAALAGVQVLHGSGCVIDGVAFYGLGYGVPETPFGAWSCDLGEDAARALLADCPDGAVLISHSPPFGAGDANSAGTHVGSRAVLEAIEAKSPRLVLCGHIHESWGAREMVGDSPVANLGPSPNWFDIT